MADDASKPKPNVEPRPKLLARPQPERNAAELAKEIMDRFPNIMARLAE